MNFINNYYVNCQQLVYCQNTLATDDVNNDRQIYFGKNSPPTSCCCNIEPVVLLNKVREL